MEITNICATFCHKCCLSHRFSITSHGIYRNLNSMTNLNGIKIVLFEQNKTGKRLADQPEKSPCKVNK